MFCEYQKWKMLGVKLLKEDPWFNYIPDPGAVVREVVQLLQGRINGSD